MTVIVNSYNLLNFRLRLICMLRFAHAYVLLRFRATTCMQAKWPISAELLAHFIIGIKYAIYMAYLLGCLAM